MAKDRNTYAKQQREVEKRRKAGEKRDRRAQRRSLPSDPYHPDGDEPELTPEEQSVMGVFRKYQMTPGKMLCFGGSDFESLRTPLTELADKGLLVADKTKGGYSLSDRGFAAMVDCA